MSGQRGEVTSIQDNAEFIDELIYRASMRGDAVPEVGVIRLDADELRALKALAMRLHLIAPFENQIRKLVIAGK